jgi:uncharacterized protein YndB with AHSA1/START domain
MSTVKHKTIKLKTVIKALPNKVFKALSNPQKKEIWSTPNENKLLFLKSDFKVGGVETFKCGPIGSMNFKGTVYYLDIIKNERIIYSETVYYKKDKLATALITTELIKNNRFSIVNMTIQVVSYCGDEMLKGYETGYKSSLNNLSKYLS